MGELSAIPSCACGKPPEQRSAAARPVERVVVEARLVRVTATPDPRTVLPYRKAMVAHTYEVQTVVEGKCDGKRIMVAHWAIRDGKVLPIEWKIGRTVRLVLERYADSPAAKGQKLVMDSDEFDLPLYYDLGN